MHCGAAVERVAAISVIRGDALISGRNDLRHALQGKLKRRHAGEAEAQTLETRVERSVGRTGKDFERTTHRGFRFGAGRAFHGARIEVELAQRLFRAAGAPVGIAGHVLDIGELAGLDLSETARLRKHRADFLDRLGGLVRAVGHIGIDRANVFGKHIDHNVERILASLQLIDHFFKVAAIGLNALLSAGDFGFLALERGETRLGRILVPRHHAHGTGPTHGEDRSGGGGAHLQTRGNLDETNLSL